MNDNMLSGEQLKQVLRSAIAEEVKSSSVTGAAHSGVKWERPMADSPKKEINITVEKAGALIIGDDAKVSVQVGSETTVGTTISTQDALDLDSLISDISESRGVEALQIKVELAKALSIPDFAFVTKENFADALRILNSWKGVEIRKAVNDQTH